MVSRIHEKLGTAGFLIAIVALIAALGGTALAAVGLNGKQKKEVTKIAKKFAGQDGKDGAPGAPGPQGPKGDPGANGSPGARGATGPAGTPGQPGEDGVCSVGIPECVLPPGATLKGTWSFDAPAGGKELGEGAEEMFFNISYPLQVVPAPEFEWVGRDEWLETGEKYNTEDCPGSFNNPEAEPGFVCLYAGAVNPNGGFGHLREPQGFQAYSGDRTVGLTGLFNIKNPEEFAYGYGTWAVTAEVEE